MIDIEIPFFDRNTAREEDSEQQVKKSDDDNKTAAKEPEIKIPGWIRTLENHDTQVLDYYKQGSRGVRKSRIRFKKYKRLNEKGYHVFECIIENCGGDCYPMLGVYPVLIDSDDGCRIPSFLP